MWWHWVHRLSILAAYRSPPLANLLHFFFCSVGHACHTCFAKELSTMTCQGIRAVLAICHVVASVAKADAQSSVLQLRCFCALVIQLLQPASCFKTNSTYRQPSVITASLVSCSVFNKLLASSQ